MPVKEFTPPRSLAVCADLLYTLQQERYALQKSVDALEVKEGVLRKHLIEKLPKSDATGVAGKVARVNIEVKTTVKVIDWDAYYANIVKDYKKLGPAAFTLLQKRVGDSAVKDMWEAGKAVPGAEPYRVPVVSIHKV